MAAVQDPIQPDESDHIEVGDSSDEDSCYGTSIASSTTSIASSVTDYVFSNGRRYPSQRWSSFSISSILPNDEIEQDRLDLIHHLYLLALKGELYLAPLKKGGVHRALDLGTGTGIWALDFADVHPECEIIGTDLSPIQSSWVPVNVRFEVDNFEDEWHFSNKFDYIHGRSLMGGVKDWPKLVKQAYDNLTPGGYFELLEVYNTGSYSHDGTYEASACKEYSLALEEAGKISGHRLDLTPSLSQFFIDAGFTNVTVKKFPIPCGVWPKDPHYKKMGAIVASQVADAVEGYGLFLLTKVLGWGEEKARDLLKRASEAYRDRRVHTVNDQYVVYGMKPMENEGKTE